MIFTYRCELAHSTENEFRVGKAPDTIMCPHRSGADEVSLRVCLMPAHRDFAADVGSITLGVVDPFRSYHLSTTKDREAQRQQREISGPTDSFERKRIERQRGIQFVGNDTSGLTARARRGIEKYKDKVACGEVKP